MAEKINILLVDDEEDFVKMLKYWLEKKDFNVDYCLNGESALISLKEKAYNILFLDLRLPDYDGVDLLKKIREFKQNLPVIIISAYGTQEKMKQAAKSGISGFFAKEENFEQAAKLIYLTLRTHKGLIKDKSDE